MSDAADTRAVSVSNPCMTRPPAQLLPRHAGMVASASHPPLRLGKLVVLPMFLIAVEVEYTLNEVLEKHGGVPLQQQVSKAKLPKAAKER